MSDAINPDHYKFSNGVEAIDITENLTSNGGQAVGYIVRSTRIDGRIKGDPIEDLEKANWFITREIERLKKNKNLGEMVIEANTITAGTMPRANYVAPYDVS